MGGKHGVENIWKVMAVGIEGLNIASKIRHNQGVFTAFQISDELMGLSSLDQAELGNEMGELDEQDRQVLRDRSKAKLELIDKGNEMKIEGSIDIADKAFGIGLQLLADVKMLIAESKAIFG